MTVTELWLADGRCAVLGEGTPDAAFAALLNAAALASAPVPADPMEVAFHEVDRALGNGGNGTRSLVHSYGLRPELLAMSNIWREADGHGPFTVAAKGAPGTIAHLCRLDANGRAAIESAAEEMAQRGIRVLGVATASAAPDDLAKAHDEHDFTLLGLVGLTDPLRPGVAAAVAECRAAGVRVVMITGDYAVTARAIGWEAGLADDGLMTGAELAALDDAALAQRIRDVTVFARTLPEQKLRIVSALKAVGALTSKAVTVKTGTLVDATIITSASEDDGDARWVKHQGKRAVHGFKAHVGADADTVLVEEVSVTSANINDGRAGARSAARQSRRSVCRQCLPRQSLP